MRNRLGERRVTARPLPSRDRYRAATVRERFLPESQKLLPARLPLTP